MLLPIPSAKSLLIYVGGAATTIVGSWVSSKIHGYQENRKAHLEDIKQRVLIPLSEALAEKYEPLVTHRLPVVADDWGVRHQKEGASVTEYPSEHGPLLTTVAPEILNATDQALYLDAKKKHFPEVIARAEHFLGAWHKHAEECYRWVLSLSEEILAECQLPAYSPPCGPEYVMQYRLALFIYRRLFRNVELALFKRNQNPGWVLEGFNCTAAVAKTEQQLDAVLAVLNKLMERDRRAADVLLQKARSIEHDFSSLCSELNYAIASRRLRRQCNLVPFL